MPHHSDSPSVITARNLTPVIPRLHDEAGSTSWLYELARRPLVEHTSSTHQAVINKA